MGDWLAVAHFSSGRAGTSRRHPRTGDQVPLRHKHLQAPSDMGGSGGAPRRATAWEAEARAVPMCFARSVNTEGPRP